MESTKQIKYGALIGYLAIVINIIAGLLYTPWMISVLGKADYGLYTLAVSLISIFMFDFGISTAVSRFVVRAHVAGDEEAVSQILGTIYKLYFVIDAVIAIAIVCMVVLLPAVYPGLTVVEVEKLRVVFAMVGAYNVLVFPTIPFAGVLSAYEQFVPLKLCDIFNKVFSICCTVIALLMGGGLFALVFCMAISGILTSGIKYYFIRNKTNAIADFRQKPKGLLKEIFSFSIWTTLVSLAQRLVFNIAPSILGAVASSSAVALFGVASTIEGYVFMIANAMNGLFVARVANISQKDFSVSRDEHIILMTKVGRIQFMIVGLIFVVFLSAGKPFIELWLGSEYDEAYYCAILMLFPSLFSSSQQIAETIVSIENKVKEQSFAFLVMALVSLGLSLPLSARFGSIGASLAICVAYLVRIAIMNVLYVKLLNLPMTSFYKACYGVLWIPLIVGYVSGAVFGWAFNVNSWPLFAMQCLSTCLAYFLVLFPMLDNYEKAQLGILLRSIFGVRAAKRIKE